MEKGLAEDQNSLSFMNPRTPNGIGDFIHMGLVPDIKGAYRTDLLKILGREPEECDIDA